MVSDFTFKSCEMHGSPRFGTLHERRFTANRQSRWRRLVLPICAIRGLRREPVAESIFGDHARKHEIEQIVWAARFGAPAGHFESAKWMSADNSAGDRPINVEVPDCKF